MWVGAMGRTESDIYRNAVNKDAVAETSVRIRLPDERLRSLVTFYYFVDCQGALSDFLYPEWGNVRFATRGAWWVESRETRSEMPQIGALFGPTDRAMQVACESGATAGFGLTPMGWQRFFDAPAASLANRIRPLGTELGVPSEAIRDDLALLDDDESKAALFDGLLLRLRDLRKPNTSAAIAVDHAYRLRPHDVAEFAIAAGVSPKRLTRLCQNIFGFGASRLLRRQKFLDTLGRIRVTDDFTFEAISSDHFFDKSHFNHEFHEFMGMAPSTYLSVPRPLMGQAALVQMQEGIPLTFELPPVET